MNTGLSRLTRILGPGLRENNTVFVCKAVRRYVPNRGENVIGIMTQKSGDIYKVDIRANEQITLSYLTIEGIMKKNRPDLQVGDVVYAKLLVASKDMEPELRLCSSIPYWPRIKSSD